jgi:HEAT repeat protein
MKRILILLGIILIIQPILSAEVATNNPNIEILRSGSYFERQKALHDLSSQRETDIRKLMDILEGNSPLEVRVDAANALGSCRAVEAVDVLMNNLTLEFQPRAIINGLVSEEELRASSWPVSTALEKIGSPAIPALMQHIASSDDAKLMGKYVSILWNIDGYDIAKIRLQAAYQAEQSAERKVRLQDALRQLEEDNAAKLQSALRQKEADKK